MGERLHRDRSAPVRSPSVRSNKPSVAAFVHRCFWRRCLHRERSKSVQYLYIVQWRLSIAVLGGDMIDARSSRRRVGRIMPGLSLHDRIRLHRSIGVQVAWECEAGPRASRLTRRCAREDDYGAGFRTMCTVISSFIRSIVAGTL